MADPTNSRQPARRVDAEGHLQAGPNWETLIERQIREAMDEGKFEDLPGLGQPLPNDDNPYAGEQALAFRMLKNAGVAPPWIESDKEVRELSAQHNAILVRATTGRVPSDIARTRDRTAIEQLVGRINEAIARVNVEAPPSVKRRLSLVLADELARYEAVCHRRSACED